MPSNITSLGKSPSVTVANMQPEEAIEKLRALHGQLTDAKGAPKGGRLALLKSKDNFEFTRRTYKITQLFLDQGDRTQTNTILNDLLKKAGVNETARKGFVAYQERRDNEGRSVKVSNVVEIINRVLDANDQAHEAANEHGLLAQPSNSDVSLDQSLLTNSEILPNRLGDSDAEQPGLIEHVVTPYDKSRNSIEALKQQLNATNWARLSESPPKLDTDTLDKLLSESRIIVPRLEETITEMLADGIDKFNNGRIREYLRVLTDSAQSLNSFQAEAQAIRGTLDDNATEHTDQMPSLREMDRSSGDLSADALTESTDLERLESKAWQLQLGMNTLVSMAMKPTIRELELKAHQETQHIADLNIAIGFQDSITQLLAQVHEFTQMSLSEVPGVTELQDKVADPVSALRSQLNETRKTLITMRDNGLIPGLKSPIGNPENVELPSTVRPDSRSWSKLALALDVADEALQNVAATNASIIEAVPHRSGPSNYYTDLGKLTTKQLIDLKSKLANLIQVDTETAPVVQQVCEQIESHRKDLREPDPIQDFNVADHELQPGADAPLSGKPPISAVQGYKDALQEIVIAAEGQRDATSILDLTQNDAYTSPANVNILRNMMHETHLVIQQLEKLNTQYEKPAVSRAADLASAQTWDKRAFGVRDTIHGRPQELISTKITETRTQLQQAYKLGMNLYNKRNEIGEYDKTRLEAAEEILAAFHSLQQLKTDAIQVMKNIP